MKTCADCGKASSQVRNRTIVYRRAGLPVVRAITPLCNQCKRDRTPNQGAKR